MGPYGTNVKILGRCSLCGGRVVVPNVFHSVIPPKPTCEKCGAVEAETNLPIIPMKPRRAPWAKSIKPWKRNDERTDPQFDYYYDRDSDNKKWMSIKC